MNYKNMAQRAKKFVSGICTLVLMHSADEGNRFVCGINFYISSLVMMRGRSCTAPLNQNVIVFRGILYSNFLVRTQTQSLKYVFVFEQYSLIIVSSYNG